MSHIITLNPYRSAQTVFPAACVPLAWCPMEKVAVFLKTFVHVSITEWIINLARVFKMAATHGTYKIFRFSFLDSIIVPVQSVRLTLNISCSICQDRRWQCTTKQCSGTCTIYGDGHHLTFDDKRYVFNGNCEYALAQVLIIQYHWEKFTFKKPNNSKDKLRDIKSCKIVMCLWRGRIKAVPFCDFQDFCSGSSTNGTFRVITENIPCGTTGTTCSKSIKLFIGVSFLY